MHSIAVYILTPEKANGLGRCENVGQIFDQWQCLVLYSSHGSSGSHHQIELYLSVVLTRSYDNVCISNKQVHSDVTLKSNADSEIFTVVYFNRSGYFGRHF